VLSHKDMRQILEDYMVEWIVEGDDEDMEMLFGNRSLIPEVLPHFQELMDFADGRLQAYQFQRLHAITKLLNSTS